MAVQPEVLPLFTDLITVTPFSSFDVYGREVYDPAAERVVASFVETRRRIVKDTDGREIISNATIYMDDVDILVTDKLAYSDGVLAQIVSVFIPRDEFGPHHAEVQVT